MKELVRLTYKDTQVKKMLYLLKILTR